MEVKLKNKKFTINRKKPRKNTKTVLEFILQQKATAEGILMRSNNEQRPFVLTRAFFAGSQRFGMHFGTLVYFNKTKIVHYINHYKRNCYMYIH